MAESIVIVTVLPHDPTDPTGLSDYTIVISTPPRSPDLRFELHEDFSWALARLPLHLPGIDELNSLVTRAISLGGKAEGPIDDDLLAVLRSQCLSDQSLRPAEAR